MPDDLLQSLAGLLNLPDLAILAIVLMNIILGFRRGLFGSLYGLAGRFAVLAAAFFAARAAAPPVARWIVAPIVGEVFEKQAALGAASGLLDGLRQDVQQAAASMAESVAFLLLFILCCVLFGWIAVILGKSLHFIAKLTPLGILDALGGGAAGLAAGVVLVCLLLIGIGWFSPITYTPLGWLSPQRVAGSVLLKALVDVLPVAI